MTARNTFDYIVIGAGIIGSGAIRHLSELDASVAVIGEPEPADLAGHDGAFASHYDSSRFYRVIDQRPQWSRLADRARRGYQALEEASGITFHWPLDYLQVSVSSDAARNEYGELERLSREFGVESVIYPTTESLARDFPSFSFPDGMMGQLETKKTAGVLNPRQFIEAELRIAHSQGALIIAERVVAVEPAENQVTVRTAQGNRYEAKKVLIAAGAWSNALLRRPLMADVEAVSVTLAEVPASDALSFASLIYRRIPEDPTVDAFYVLPAVQYPDGKYYVKGGMHWQVTPVAGDAELNSYFRADPDHGAAKIPSQVFTDIIPELRQATSWTFKSCAQTLTPNDLPFIDAVEPDQVYVAFGGNGYAAKCGDELGRLAAGLMATGAWQDTELAASDFAAIYRDE